MSTKQGTMATDRPERYAKQLASHWAAKAEVSEAEGATTIVMGGGQTAVLRPADGELRIEAGVPDDGEADVDRWAEVVAAHLQRFGQRDELEVVWSEEHEEPGAGTNPSGNDADDQHAPEVATDPEHRD